MPEVFGLRGIAALSAAFFSGSIDAVYMDLGLRIGVVR